MKWIENLENILSKKSPGKCPYCGSTETDFSITTISDNMGCCDIWCNTCKRAFHMSRMKTEGLLNTKKEVPDGLKFC